MKPARARSMRTLMGMTLALLLAASVVCGLPGCAYVESRRIETEVSEALDRFKSPTSEEAASLFAGLGLDVSGLEEVGLDASAFAQHLLAGFDYTIDAVEVEGARATVELSVEAHDNLAVARQLSEEMARQGDDYLTLMLGQDGDRALTEQFFAELFDRVDAQTGTVSQQVTLVLDKSDGAWQMEPVSEAELARAMLGLEARPAMEETR